LSSRVRYIVLTIGLAIFSYLVYSYGIANILTNLGRTGWWFLPIVLVWAIVYFCNAVAWYSILHDHHPDVSLLSIYRLTISAFALNYVTPFLNLGGEPYRVMALNGRVDKHRAISSVILYNMIRWLAHFFFWITGIAVAIAVLTPSLPFAAALAAICIALTFLVAFFMSRHKNGIFESLISWISSKRILKRYAAKLEPHKPTLLVIDKQIKQLYLHQRKTFYKSIAFEYVSRIIASLEFYFILKALGYSPTFLQAIYINAASSFILNMLFFVPFELGTREGGLYFIMQSIGYTQGIGIFIGLVNRLRELAWILIGMTGMLKSHKVEGEDSLLEMMEEEEKP